MTKIIHYTLFILQFIVICISFIYSLRLIKNNNVPNYLKGFFWYPLIGILVGIPVLIFKFIFIDYKEIAIIINNISIIFHFGFLSHFIIKVISNNKNLKYLVLLFFLIEVLIVYTLTNYPLNKVNNSAFFISNFGLVIFCIIYFNELFKNMPVIDLKATPSFWIITGILFCMSAHFPIAATLDFLNGKVSFFVIKNLSNVLVVSYIIMHIFFIKAFLCVTHRLKG